MSRKNGKDCKCLVCGKTKYIPQSHILKGEGKFCSYECRNKDYKKRIPHNKGHWFEDKCKYCNIIFTNGVKGYIKKFHNRECANRKNKRLGADNHNFKNGRQKCGNGYMMVVVPNHPNADKRGRVLEHRYIMEQYIGRYLQKNEIIDHLNEITDDNRIENLEIVTHGENLRRSRERKQLKTSSK